MSELKQKIARNLAVSVGGRALSGALAVASVAFVTRALGTEGFGEYSLVLTILYIASVFGGFGLDALLARDIAKEGADEKAVVGRIVFARAAFLLVFLGAGAGITLLLPYSTEVRWGVAIASLGALFFSLAQALTGVFQKHLATHIPAFAEVLVRCIQLALVFLLYRAGAGLLPFLYVFVLGGAIQLVWAWWWVVSRVGIRMRVRADELRAVAREGWPLAASAVLTLIYFRGDTILLSLMKTAHDVGVYSVAYKVLEHAIFIPIAFAGLVLPLLARSAFINPARFAAVFRKAFDFLALLAFPFAVGGIYLSADIVRILAGAAFAEAALPLALLFVAIVFIFFGALFGNALIALSKQRTAMWIYGAGAVFNIAANLYFIERYSYMGAAAVTAATELLVSGLMFVAVLRFARFSPSFALAGKAAAAALAMGCVLALSPVQNAAVLVVLGAAFYAALMRVLGGITKADLLLFFRKGAPESI